MPTHHPENERIKREYFEYLKEAKRQSDASLDGVAKSLSRFEQYTKYRDFKAFHSKQAVGFKAYLAQQQNARTGAVLSKATLNSTLASLKRFFQWLAGYPGYRSKFSYSDAEYFNLSEKEVRIASARRDQRAPTLEQIHHAIAQMPQSNEIERRNRALIAFATLTGARDAALASAKLRHIDLMTKCFMQDAREVKTKFSKTFTTYFFPVGGDALTILNEWVEYLRKEKLWGSDDPLFPATQIAHGGGMQFRSDGLARKGWSNASPIRSIFKKAFEQAGLPYYNPHSFRNTLTQLGQQLCKSPEDFKAWSQNLGHEQVLTTFISYGQVGAVRQSEIIQNLGTMTDLEGSDQVKSLIRQTIQEMQRQSA